ncbi:MAG: adenylate kinase [Planctomycetes bacterium DG_20]|nr:MAG: adenylate kinase [Planctomycetes bacterium DG_20]
MRLVFMGPPGAGKGTQAKAVAEQYNIPHVSSGDIFRAEIAAGSELGRQIREYLDSGALVPDETTVRAVVGRLGADDCADGWLLDGFPRTLAQAEALDGALEAGGATLDAVVYLEVDPEAIVRRMAGRRVCPKCGRSYHTQHIPPKVEGTCDACGNRLMTRDDDKPETVRQRLATYQKATAPLIGYYDRRGLLVRTDGTGTPDEVRARLFEQLKDVERG